MNSKINKRLKDALFTDQWSELFMDVLSPFHFILVRMSHRSWAAGPSSVPARRVDHGEGELDCRGGWREGGGLVGEPAGGTGCCRDNMLPSKQPWGLAWGLVVCLTSMLCS